MYDIKVYEYRLEPYGWVSNSIGIEVKLERIHHYYLWSDEIEVYYLARDRYNTEIIFKAITYYPEVCWYELGEWCFSSVNYNY